MINIGTIIGFMAQVFLGNLCLMPVAFAASMPVAPEMHMEMVMTPVVPMSPLHCDDCIAVQEQSGEFQAQGCAGHCLVQGRSTAVNLASSSTPVVSATIHFAMIPVSEEVTVRIGALAMGPPIALHIDTTVLRL